jgi:acetylglutamate kinase
MLEVVTMVYGGLVNKSVVAGLQALNVNALGLTGADLNLVLAHKRTGAAIDYGFVGDVDSVQAGLLMDLIQKGVVPVVAPLTHDGAGQLLNTNADTMASALAVALSSQFNLRLVYCFEKPGVLSNPENDDSVIPRLSVALFQKYLQEGIISEGMIPKLDNGFSALKNGVSEVIITNTKGLARVGSGTALEL